MIVHLVNLLYKYRETLTISIFEKNVGTCRHVFKLLIIKTVTNCHVSTIRKSYCITKTYSSITACKYFRQNSCKIKDFFYFTSAGW
jgi:hypothetical protein